MTAPGTRADGRYVFQGREVTMPVVVRDATSDGRDVSRVRGGRATAAARARRSTSSKCSRARRCSRSPSSTTVDNDLGDYHEVSLAFFVRERGRAALVPYLGDVVDFFRNRLATWIWHLPVDQSLHARRGRRHLGVPEDHPADRLRRHGGRPGSAASSWAAATSSPTPPAAAARCTLPDTPMKTYTYIGGRLHRTTFTSGASEVGFALGGATLELGDHPIADSSAASACRGARLMTVWMGHQHGTFESPIPA